MALRFAPFASEIELPFYTALSQSKIDHDKLDDSARRVLGLYEPRPHTDPNESCKMQVLGNALSSDESVFLDHGEAFAVIDFFGSVPSNNIRAEGKIRNFNTIEEFKTTVIERHHVVLETSAKQVSFSPDSPVSRPDKDRSGTRLTMAPSTQSPHFSHLLLYFHSQI